MIFYFSGVGNSAWVANKLAECFNDKVLPIADEIGKKNTYFLRKGEKVGFIFPVYGWEPPKIVMDFIAEMQMDSPHYLYFVCTCGDDVGKTPKVFESAIKRKGWKCDAGFSVTMPDTYVCLPGFDIDDETTLQIKMDNAKARVEYIGKQIADDLHMDRFDCYEGPFPYLKTYVLGGLFRAFLMSPKPFKATDKCISCGLCAKKCPVHNINVDSKPQWGNRCTMCLACYHACPYHAIEYGKRTRNKGQYSI